MTLKNKWGNIRIFQKIVVYFDWEAYEGNFLDTSAAPNPIVQGGKRRLSVSTPAYRSGKLSKRRALNREN
jgi:hypothetical protein